MKASIIVLSCALSLTLGLPMSNPSQSINKIQVDGELTRWHLGRDLGNGVTVHDVKRRIFRRDLGDATDNVGNIVGNVGNATGNVGNIVGHVGDATGNVGNIVGNVGNATDYVGNATYYVGNATGNVGNIVGHVGDATGNVGNIVGNVGNVGNATDYVGNATYYLGNATDNVGNIVSGHDPLFWYHDNGVSEIVSEVDANGNVGNIVARNSYHRAGRRGREGN